MTKPDLTNTAPADICKPFGYVRDNCGDGHVFQHAPFSESEGLVHSTAEVYSRAQMLSALAASGPTPAASGAAPADTFRGNNAQLINCINAALSLDLDGCLAQPLGSFGRDLLSAASVRLAALASREASPAALTDEPTVPEDVLVLVRKYGDARADDMGWAQATVDLVHGLRRWAAALASPQVAPAPDHSVKTAHELVMKWADIYAAQTGNLYAEAARHPSKTARMAPVRADLSRVLSEALATPVQVAPPKLTHEQINDEVRRIRRTDDSWESLPEIRLAQWAYARGIEAAFAAAPVAPQDDARDAARYRFIRDVPYAPGLRTVMTHQLNARMDDVIDSLMSTPAAKPTEEQGS